MLVSFLLPLLFAILAFWLAYTVTGEAEKLTLFLLSSGCLLSSVAMAPWIVQLLLVLGLLATPTCMAHAAVSTGCPRVCALRQRVVHLRDCSYPYQGNPKL